MNKFQPNSRHIGCFSPQFLYNSTKQTSLSIFAEILNDRKHSEGTKKYKKARLSCSYSYHSLVSNNEWYEK